MANLTASKRKTMPRSAFALSGHRFPINDATHQRLAISGATRAERAGNISASTAAKIKSEALARLHSADKAHNDHMKRIVNGLSTHRLRSK